MGVGVRCGSVQLQYKFGYDCVRLDRVLTSRFPDALDYCHHTTITQLHARARVAGAIALMQQRRRRRWRPLLLRRLLPTTSTQIVAAATVAAVPLLLCVHSANTRIRGERAASVWGRLWEWGMEWMITYLDGLNLYFFTSR